MSLTDTPARDLSGEDRYELAGTVERVTFHNPDTGFSVLRVKASGHRRPVALVAHAPAVEPGERVQARGLWVHDPKFGLQFKADELRAALPGTLEGIERYLGSGLIDGIGPVHAGRLVRAFGESVFDVIEHEPWRLRDVLGIGPLRTESIRAAWARQRGVREIILFLHAHGVPAERALRIHEAYGATALRLLRSDPYRVGREVRGFGFAAADALARAAGLRADDPVRLRAGLLHVLDEAAEEGSCGLAVAEAEDRALALLAVGAPHVTRALEEEVQAGRIVREADADGVPCLHPAWLHRAERSLADRIVALGAGELPWPWLPWPWLIDAAAAPAELAGIDDLLLGPGQRQALLALLRSKLAVLTGGPGVGKTTLVSAVVRVLRARGVRIALVAPTGRAARRLAEATGQPASTIHRLLEVDPAGGFRRNRDRPLDIDLLVVDEASMLDVRLAGALLAAVPLRAAVLFVGDADQLPSIGPGRVLADLIGSGAVPVVRLTEVFRQAAASRIVQAAHRVHAGAVPEAPPPGEASDFYMIETRSPDVCLERILQAVRDRIPDRFGLDPRRDIQVLSPMNRGGLGTRALNAALQAALNPDTGPRLTRGGIAFACGDRVMQVENDPERDICNGDLGIVAAVDVEANALTVEFDGRLLDYAGPQLDRLALAYACSVHKAQGSEFPAVVVPLTLQHAPMLRRPLLYTAITRGRKLVLLVGDRRALELAVGTAGERPRRSTLARRLREAAAQLRSARTSCTPTPATAAPSNVTGPQRESVLTGTRSGG